MVTTTVAPPTRIEDKLAQVRLTVGDDLIPPVGQDADRLQVVDARLKETMSYAAGRRAR